MSAMTSLFSKCRQPGVEDWRFVDELKQPLYAEWSWRRRPVKKGEVFLGGGTQIVEGFPDSSGALRTAYASTRRLLSLGGVPEASEGYRIVTSKEPTEIFEAYRISAGAKECVIAAGDVEGIRRGLFRLESMMLEADGPFLKTGTLRRKPVVRTRISRCFFGPTKRPPRNIDELANDVDYYPHEYLNRLAHDGVNALWLTISFFDIYPSPLIPGSGAASAKRLEKLRWTVARCADYGIKIYPFFIEPAALPSDSEVFKAHPELKGHVMSGLSAFCTSSKTGQGYLADAMRFLFSSVPGLGGAICIPVGERFTHCMSSGLEGSEWGSPNNCPRCSKRKPWEVLNDTLSAMERGMHSANPEAALVAWPYTQYLGWGEKLTVDAAGRLPKNVALQHNFESGGRTMQAGKMRTALDYWLSYVGPSHIFAGCAKRATANGTRIFAKLQAACSYEVATVPFVPVPGNIYRKYKAIHKLGVSGVMQSWYPGNYPSIMTKSAGETLSFAPFPKTESEFLLRLAKADWHDDASEVAKAWKLFQEGYSNFPVAHIMGYYGPMHDGPVWPLLLEPENAPLFQSWRFDLPPSGDQIGECLGEFSCEEAISLFEKMDSSWRKGVEILKALRPKYSGNHERLLDIGVAVALGLQFHSGLNIFRFYQLRERLAEGCGLARLQLLDMMEAIVKDEIAVDEEFLPLAQDDSRLGFHSEAEGYKYFPEKIRVRMNALRRLLRTGFPKLRERVKNDPGPVFPAYTGEEPNSLACRCGKLKHAFSMKGWASIPAMECGFWGRRLNDLLFEVDESYQLGRSTEWQTGHDTEAIYFKVRCHDPEPSRIQADLSSSLYWIADSVCINVKPDRLGPHHRFVVAAGGAVVHLQGERTIQDRGFKAACEKTSDGWQLVAKIPFRSLGLEKSAKIRPLRFNITRLCAKPEGRTAFNSWVEPSSLKCYRLCLGSVNPAKDFGWLIFN